jgi:hypothetical protein
MPKFCSGGFGSVSVAERVGGLAANAAYVLHSTGCAVLFDPFSGMAPCCNLGVLPGR